MSVTDRDMVRRREWDKSSRAQRVVCSAGRTHHLPLTLAWGRQFLQALVPGELSSIRWWQAGRGGQTYTLEARWDDLQVQAEAGLLPFPVVEEVQRDLANVSVDLQV